MINKINNFSLAFDVAKGIKYERTSGKLLYQNNPVNTILEGCVIEHQFKIGEHYLLFTSKSDPFNEAINIYYLSRDFKIIDHILMINCGVISNADVLEDVKPINNRTLFIDFITEKPWKLTVFKNPKLYLYAWRPFHVFRPSKKFYNKVYLGISHYLNKTVRQ